MLSWQGSEVTDAEDGPREASEWAEFRPAFATRTSEPGTPTPEVEEAEETQAEPAPLPLRRTSIYESLSSSLFGDEEPALVVPLEVAWEIEEQDMADVSLALDEIDPFSPAPVDEEAAEVAEVSFSLDTPLGAQYPVLRLRVDLDVLRRDGPLRSPVLQQAPRAASNAAEVETFEDDNVEVENIGENSEDDTILPPPATVEIPATAEIPAPGLTLNSALNMTIDVLRSTWTRVAGGWHAVMNFRVDGHETTRIIVMGVVAACIPLMTRYFPNDQSPSQIMRR